MQTLREILSNPSRREQWSNEKLCAVLFIICRKLAVRHAKKGPYFALCPETILVSEDDSSLVEAPDRSQKSLFLGYTAPEQIRNDVVGSKADLFSLGAILYEIITGQRAFIGENDDTLRQAILASEPVLPSGPTECPTTLRMLCEGLLTKDPKNRRPESAEAVALLLGTYLNTPLPEYATRPLKTLLLEQPINPHATTVAAAETAPTRTENQAEGRDLPEVGAENYEVSGEYARGGLGRILKAKDKRLGRPVALKELLRNQGNAEHRFLREALITARLQHPSIVPIYEAGRWPSGEPFYAMKMVSGKPLNEVIQSTKTLSERLALLPKVIAVSEAMAYAHSEKIIHRDLKPHNILVGDFGETIVIDWGLAKDLAEPNTPELDVVPYRSATDGGLTVAGSVMGTPAYMPPEQARGLPLDSRADVYALGAILYHLLSGEPPYQEKNSGAILSRVLSGPPPSLEKKQQGVPGDLLAIVNKAMARDPATRYTTAEALTEDLKKFQTGQLVGAYRYSRTERFSRFVKRNRAASLIAVVAALVISVTFWRLLVARDLADTRSREAQTSESNAKLAQKKAETARDEAEYAQKLMEEEQAKSARSFVALLEEQGRQELLSGRPQRAVVLLSKAYSRAQEYGEVSASLRFLLAAAMRPVDAQLLSLKGHSASVNTAHFDHDGARIVTTCEDGTAKLWKASTGELIASLEGHTSSVAEFSPDGSKLVTAINTSPGTAKVWDIKGATAKPLISLEGHPTGINSIKFSPDGTRVVTSSNDNTAKVFDALSGKLISSLEGHEGAVTYAEFSPDGARVVTSSFDNTAKIWDASSSQLLASLAGHSDWVSSAKFSHDGTRVATTSFDNTTKVFDALSGKQLASLEGHTGSITSVEFSPDDKRIVTASSDRTTKLWDASSGRQLTSLDGHSDEVNSAKFSPDGAYIVTASNDRTAKIFEATTGALITTLEGHSNLVSTAEFSPDGTHVLTASLDQTAKIFTTNTTSMMLASLEGHSEEVLSAKFSPNSTHMVTSSADQTSIEWSVKTAKSLFSLKGRTAEFSPNSAFIVTTGTERIATEWNANTGVPFADLAGHTDIVLFAKFSPDGSRVLTVSNDRSAKLFDASTPSGPVLTLGTSTESIYLAEFSPDNTRVVTACVNEETKENTIKIWDAKTAALLTSTEGALGQVFFVDFSQDSSRILASSADENAAKIFDASSATLLVSLEGHSNWVNWAQFSPDGKRVITASRDGTAKIFDAGSGELLVSLEGHTSGLTTVEFSSSGNLILTASNDKTAKLWEASSGKLLASMSHADAINAASFSPDGAYAVTASKDKTAKLWDVQVESRSSEEIAALVEERVPWRLVDGRLLPVSTGGSIVRGQTTDSFFAPFSTKPSSPSAGIYLIDGIYIKLGTFINSAKVKDPALVAELKTLLEKQLATSGKKVTALTVGKKILVVDGSLKKLEANVVGKDTSLTIEISLTVSRNKALLGLFNQSGSIEFTGKMSAADEASGRQELLEALVPATYENITKNLKRWR